MFHLSSVVFIYLDFELHAVLVHPIVCFCFFIIVSICVHVT